MSRNIEEKDDFVANPNLIAQKGMYEVESPFDNIDSLKMKHDVVHKVKKEQLKKMNNLYMINKYAICGSDDEEYYFRTQIHN